MKVRNLYIGDIMIVNQEKTNSESAISDRLLTTRVLRKTVLYRLKNNRVKDVLLGGKYKIAPSDGEFNAAVGDEYATNLDQYYLSNYGKEKISRKQLKERFKFYILELKKEV